MAKGVRISDNLYRLAQLEAVLENRSIAQQIEYWAKRGMGSARVVSEERADYGASVDAALEATRRLDILDVESGTRKAEDLHFVPRDIARESEVVGRRGYRKSSGG
jgi:parvulin-like peptidyl-prolyl isomerase